MWHSYLQLKPKIRHPTLTAFCRDSRIVIRRIRSSPWTVAAAFATGIGMRTYTLQSRKYRDDGMKAGMLTEEP